jgi:catechol 2,3-dioxygenase-like lactoylglutathione lyase family enzyme
VLHHLTLWVPDLERARGPWSWLLGRLGYSLEDSSDSIVLFRDGQGFAFVIEQSADMVPGMLYSRLRPGLNHVAFRLDSSDLLGGILREAGTHGWSDLPVDRHPIAGAALVGYLEDSDGFEVELVAPY